MLYEKWFYCISKMFGWKPAVSYEFSACHGEIISHNVFNIFVNSFPNDKILDWSKVKQIADDILKLI